MSAPSLLLTLVLGAAPGFTLRLESDRVRAGDTVLGMVETEDRSALRAAEAVWLGKKVTLYPEREGRVLILLPVPLQARGELTLEVSAVLAGYERDRVSAVIQIQVPKSPDDEDWRAPAGLEAETLRTEADQVVRALAQAAGPRRFAGDFEAPVAGPVAGLFGANRRSAPSSPAAAEMPLHLGLDLKGRDQASIHSPQAGVVLWVATLPSLGETVLVDHGLGVVSMLAHLDAAGVRAGDRVSRRSVLGWSGATGNVPQPLLHFGIYVQGIAVDPRRFEKLPRWLEKEAPGETAPTPRADYTPPPAALPPAPATTPRPSPSRAPTPTPVPVPGPTQVATPPVLPDFPLEELPRLLRQGIAARLLATEVSIETPLSPRPPERSSDREPASDLVVEFVDLGAIPFFTAVETSAYVTGELTSISRLKTDHLIVRHRKTGQTVTLLTRDARQLWRERTGQATPVPRDAAH